MEATTPTEETSLYKINQMQIQKIESAFSGVLHKIQNMRNICWINNVDIKKWPLITRELPRRPAAHQPNVQDLDFAAYFLFCIFQMELKLRYFHLCHGITFEFWKREFSYLRLSRAGLKLSLSGREKLWHTSDIHI